jgi:hypothetical protein
VLAGYIEYINNEIGDDGKSRLPSQAEKESLAVRFRW